MPKDEVETEQQHCALQRKPQSAVEFVCEARLKEEEDRDSVGNQAADATDKKARKIHKGKQGENCQRPESED